MANIIIFADNTMDDMVFQPTHPTLGRRVPSKSIGAYRVATEIRKAGFTCQVIQLFTSFTSEELEHICKKFIDSETIAVTFSTAFWLTVRFGVTGQIVNNIVEKVKKLNNDVQIIFGGTNALTLLDYVKNVDAIFLGYSEAQFTNYLLSVRNNTTIPKPSRKESNTLIYDVTASDQTFDFCRSQIIYQPEDCVDSGESIVLEVGRGCIFKCKFCAYPLTGKKKLDFIKDYDVLTEELIYNYEKFGIYKYQLSDDTFNDSSEKIERLHKIFTSLPFKIYFSCYLRLDLLYAHPEQISLLYEMGLRGCHFGIESFYDRAARSIGKGLSGDKAKNFLHKLKNELWNNEVKVRVSLITGLPYETYESYEETKQWILDPNNSIDGVLVFALELINPVQDRTPYKSEFQMNASKYGYYWPDSKQPRLWKNLTSPVKQFTDAQVLANDLTTAIRSVNREKVGGFDIFAMDSIVKYFDDSYSFEDQLKMDRFEYIDWTNRNYKKASERYLQNYIDSILNL
jgi:radical SAM superfamily enzyme YgiQ (UPF0313 family)